MDKINKFTDWFVLKESSIHSTGVFAKVNIPKGTRIIEYVGEKITKKESGRRVDVSIESHQKNNSDGAVYNFELNKRHDLDGNVPYNRARLINHSCDPNAETEIIRGKIWIIAFKDIAQGEEITYNYGYDFDDDYMKHPCRCQSARCVGFILNEDHWPRLRELSKMTNDKIQMTK